MATEFRLNYSQPACSFLGDYSWREEYLTPTNLILIGIAVLVESLMIPFTVLFNALVFFLVWRKRYLRKRKPCALLACLAATDLLVGAVVLPSVITGHAFRLSRASVCLVDAATWTSGYFGCGASVLHLAIISGERYVAIKHSLRYETLVTARRLTAAVATAWAIPAVLTLGALINSALAGTLSYVVALIALLGSVAAISFCQITVFLESRRHLGHICHHQVSEAEVREILKRDKAARTTTMVIGALLLCYAPAALFDAVTLLTRLPVDVVYGVFSTTYVFMYLNSLVNPIIYCLRTQDFKRALRELFGCKAPQVTAQSAENPIRVVRRRISEAWPSSSSSGGKQHIACPSELAPVRSSRSHSLDLPGYLAAERRNCRMNCV